MGVFMNYESLVSEIEDEGIICTEFKMKGSGKGYYCDSAIAIDSKIETDAEKRCVLIEEFGHVKYTYGNILDCKKISNMKQEKIARNFGYEKLVGIVSLINAYKKGIQSKYDLAEYLNVTEEFLDDAIQHYREKYGVYCNVDNYLIYFEPSLIIMEIF